MNNERVSGFSLVEVMIGVAVFAIMMLAIGQAAMVGQATSNEVKEQANTLLGCQRIMDQLLTYSLTVLQGQNGSNFSVRLSGPDTPLVAGGRIVIDKDLNGNGTIQTGDLFREGRTQNDIFRAALYYKKLGSSPTDIIKTENLVIQRVITLRR